MEWTTPAEYVEISESVTVPDSCGCAVIGLISVTDCKSNTVGLLTPNDASIYYVNTIEVPVGFVKVFEPSTGNFLGVLSVEEAESYLTFLNNL